MKNLLLTIGAVALTAMTINATASDSLLSPRAAGNQINRVTGMANDAKPVGALGALPPRATGNQIAVAAGASAQVNPVTLCAAHMTASPKAIQACAANPGNMVCCGVAATR